MNSIEFLSCVFQLIKDLKHASIRRLDAGNSEFFVNLIFNLDGDDDE